MKPGYPAFQPIPQSRLEGVAWPSIVGGEAAQLLAILHQLEQSQWWSPEQLLEHQLQQLQVLLRHAYQTVPFYQRRLAQMGFNPSQPLTLERWQQLPILTRTDLQTAQAMLKSQLVPQTHGKIGLSKTAGSTGQPVQVCTTELTNFFWRVFTLRDHLWHRRNFQGKSAVIRAGNSSSGIGPPPHGSVHPSWGAPVSLLYATGPSVTLDIQTDISLQAAWLQQHEPDYLLTYPSNAIALAEYFQRTGATLSNLKQIRTISESVNSELSDLCWQTWGARVVDIYSSQEVSYMALQCPECNHYHIQSEGVLLEILDEQGNPCSPGQLGRVIVTNLHNFATPMIRYEILDYAIPGSACACGRGLPTLERIVGRQRNMVTFPNGEQQWPMTGFKQYRNIAPVRQYQLVQKQLHQIEARFVVERPLSEAEELELKTVIQSSLGYPFEIAFVYLDQIPRSAAGKFEEFLSEVRLNH